MLKTALFAGVVGFAPLAGIAHAGPKYDVKIEQAAKKIIAKKVGDIRGGVDLLVGFPKLEAERIEVAAADINPVKASPSGRFASPSQPYRSGRPEPVRKVRKITSFIFY